MRLGFSVAVNMDRDILLVEEVLAVPYSTHPTTAAV
jgi:ABC-type polysaccharide/polyol phosphate transport system ATPase subunit